MAPLLFKCITLPTTVQKLQHTQLSFLEKYGYCNNYFRLADMKIRINRTY